MLRMDEGSPSTPTPAPSKALAKSRVVSAPLSLAASTSSQSSAGGTSKPRPSVYDPKALRSRKEVVTLFEGFTKTPKPETTFLGQDGSVALPTSKLFTYPPPSLRSKPVEEVQPFERQLGQSDMAPRPSSAAGSSSTPRLASVTLSKAAGAQSSSAGSGSRQSSTSASTAKPVASKPVAELPGAKAASSASSGEQQEPMEPQTPVTSRQDDLGRSLAEAQEDTLQRGRQEERTGASSPVAQGRKGYSPERSLSQESEKPGYFSKAESKAPERPVLTFEEPRSPVVQAAGNFHSATIPREEYIFQSVGRNIDLINEGAGDFLARYNLHQVSELEVDPLLAYGLNNEKLPHHSLWSTIQI